MKTLIEQFSRQLKDARQIGQMATLRDPGQPIFNITLLGLGGSAFGGEIVKNYIESKCKVPFNIVREYDVPAYIRPESLVIVSSYSGNTEETLSAFDQALKKGSKIVCISSGGKLAEQAKIHDLDIIFLPPGYPPRTAAGFSITQILFILNRFGLIGGFSADFDEAVGMVENFDDHELARALSDTISGGIPILYASHGNESVVIRWRQQIEENAKQLAYYHIVPEMNHNELVGWEQPQNLLKQLPVIFFESDLDNPRVLLRMGINKELIAKTAGSVTTVHAKGKGKLAQLIYLLHLGDWVSYYLAEANEVDPGPVKVIDFLKTELAKQ